MRTAIQIFCTSVGCGVAVGVGLGVGAGVGVGVGVGVGADVVMTLNVFEKDELPPEL